MNHRIVAGYVLAIALGLGFAYWRHAPDGPGESSGKRGTAAEESAASRSADANPADSESPEQALRRQFRTLPPTLPRDQWAELPDERMSLVATYAGLKARADRGDPTAACRLSAELDRCRRHYWMEDLASSNKVLDPDFQVDHLDPTMDPKRHCAGVDPAWYQNQLKYLRQAARAGSVPAIEAYVSGHVMSQDPYHASLLLDDYRKEAQTLMEAALRGGSQVTLYNLINANDQSGAAILPFSAAAVADDHSVARQVALVKVLARVWEGHEDVAFFRETMLEIPASFDLSEAQMKSLDAWADRQFQDWFQGTTQNFEQAWYLVNVGGAESLPLNARCSSDYVPDPMAQEGIDWPAL